MNLIDRITFLLEAKANFTTMDAASLSDHYKDHKPSVQRTRIKKALASAMKSTAANQEKIQKLQGMLNALGPGRTPKGSPQQVPNTQQPQSSTPYKPQGGLIHKIVGQKLGNKIANKFGGKNYQDAPKQEQPQTKKQGLINKIGNHLGKVGSWVKKNRSVMADGTPVKKNIQHVPNNDMSNAEVQKTYEKNDATDTPKEQLKRVDVKEKQAEEQGNEQQVKRLGGFKKWLKGKVGLKSDEEKEQDKHDKIEKKLRQVHPDLYKEGDKKKKEFEEYSNTQKENNKKKAELKSQQDEQNAKDEEDRKSLDKEGEDFKANHEKHGITIHRAKPNDTPGHHKHSYYFRKDGKRYGMAYGGGADNHIDAYKKAKASITPHLKDLDSKYPNGMPPAPKKEKKQGKKI